MSNFQTEWSACGRIPPGIRTHLSRLVFAIWLLAASVVHAEDSVSFSEQIAPILQAQCVACHGPKKAESNYRVDTFAAAMKAANDEMPVVANDLDASLLFQRLVTTDSDLRMPAESDALSDEQIELFRQWIREGAKFDGVESIETPDAQTVVINFAEPKPNPYGPFTGGESPIIQAAQFADCLGAKAPECTDANFGPIGTGPFKVVEFRPNDVITMEANPNFREAGKPAFATLTFKGGGDATAAGRSVLETGEFDYAWNLQLAPDVIAKMEEGGKGKAIAGFGPLVERLEMNMTNPSPDLPPETRATVAEPHPFLTDEGVRRELSMAIDRELLTEVGYGKAGTPTCNLVPAPAVYASDNTACLTQDIDGANAMLEAAGWVKGGDGIRAKDGVRLSILYQTSTNAVRQDFQALIKDWWSQIGVETELRNLDASVFFGGDPGSPDTFQKFYADVEMYANTFNGTDPQSYLGAYRCGNEPKPSSQWQGENINRFCDPAYDALLDELARTGDIDKRGEIGRKLNDMLTKDTMTIVPLVNRARSSAHANSLGGVVLNVWDSELWNVKDWYRIDG